MDVEYRSPKMSDSLLSSQDGVLKLTHDVRNFSEALSALKNVFLHYKGVHGEVWLVKAHKHLGELLSVLKQVVDKYDKELKSEDVLSSATNLIQHVKNFDYEDTESEVSPEIFRAMNSLAMSFSNSVSECLTGDPYQVVDTMMQSQSSEDLSQANINDNTYISPNVSNEEVMMLISDDDNVLNHVNDGMEIALERAKVLKNYMSDLLNYAKNKAKLEVQHANSLMKITSDFKQKLTDQSYLPFQSVYCTAIDNDREFASNSIVLYQERVLLQMFVEPLKARKNDYERICKESSNCWFKEKRKTDEAIKSLKNCKTAYISRMQEMYKARDAASKAGNKSSAGAGSAAMSFQNYLGTTTAAGKAERKRQKEEESIVKARNAEASYKSAINEANKRVEELECLKTTLLQKLKLQSIACDQAIKAATTNYLQMHQELYQPQPVLYQALNHSAKDYEPGQQYRDFINLEKSKLSNSPQLSQKTTYKFEPFSHDGLTSDTDSVMSHDDLSPPPIRHSSIDDSISSEDPLNAAAGESHLSVPSESATGFTPESSPVINKRASKQNLTKKMKGMLMNRKSHKPLFFGIPFSQASQGSPDGIPLLVKRCVACIDNNALSTKGIYRVNGVKGRIEKICAQMDISPDRVDLTTASHHDVSGVMKYFLRQLPEPLMMFSLYDSFLKIGKEYQSLITESNETTEKLRKEGKEVPPSHNADKFDAVLFKIRENINKLPTANRNTLQYIVSHLTRVATFSKENKMTESNLSVVFGPTLMRAQTSSNGTDSLMQLVEIPFQSRIVETLLHHKDFIFGTLTHTAGVIFPYCGFNQDPPTTPFSQPANEVKPTHPTSDEVTSENITPSSSKAPTDSSEVHFTLQDDATTTPGDPNKSGQSSPKGSTDSEEKKKLPTELPRRSHDSNMNTAWSVDNSVTNDDGRQGAEVVQHSARVRRTSDKLQEKQGKLCKTPTKPPRPNSRRSSRNLPSRQSSLQQTPNSSPTSALPPQKLTSGESPTNDCFEDASSC